MRMYTWMLLQELRLKRQAELTIIFVTKDNKVVTPKSDSILPSITRRSLMYVAEHYLGFGSRAARSYIWMK